MPDVGIHNLNVDLTIINGRPKLSFFVFWIVYKILNSSKIEHCIDNEGVGNKIP